MIAEWIANTMHHLKDVQKLYRKLLHASLMVPDRRAYLTNLESMLSTFNNCPFVPHHAPRGTTQDLEWWTKTLSLPSVTRAIPGPMRSLMPKLTPMPALVLALLSPLVTGGEHGSSSQDRSLMDVTLDGWKPLGLSSWRRHSLP